MEHIDPSLVPQRTLFDGTKVPCVGFGTFGSDHYPNEVVAESVATAIKAGYRMIDGASVYGNEKLIGQVYKDIMDSGVAKREELFLMTKIWNDMHGKGDVLLSLAQSLKDLQLDYVDCLFVHWPFPNYHAPRCTVDSRNPDSKPFDVDRFMATWRQCERLVDMGLTRYIGMSNMTIPKLEAVLPLCRIKPAMIEMELHPSFQQKELYDYIVKTGSVPVGFCPLGSPNRPERDKTPEDVDDMQLPEVVEVAKAHNVHPAVICLKWACARGHIAIPLSSKEKNIVSNLKAMVEDPLTEEEMKKLEKADRNCRLVKGQVFLWPGAKSWEDLWDLDGTITK